MKEQPRITDITLYAKAVSSADKKIPFPGSLFPRLLGWQENQEKLEYPWHPSTTVPEEKDGYRNKKTLKLEEKVNKGKKVYQDIRVGK